LEGDKRALPSKWMESNFGQKLVDNYKNRLDEPSLSKVIKLIEAKRGFEIGVYEKTLRRAWWER
jgi:hypothetical protein